VRIPSRSLQGPRSTSTVIPLGKGETLPSARAPRLQCQAPKVRIVLPEAAARSRDRRRMMPGRCIKLLQLLWLPGLEPRAMHRHTSMIAVLEQDRRIM